MNERLEMTCEGCADRFVYDEPVVSIADFLRAAIGEGWREIEEQEIIPAVREQGEQHFRYSFVALFDALCPACVARVKEHRRAAALRQPQ